MNFYCRYWKRFQNRLYLFCIRCEGTLLEINCIQNYKAQKTRCSEDLLTQLPIAISWVEEMGFKIAIRTGI